MTIHRVVGFVALLLSVAPAPRAAVAQELVQNGGFEDGSAPWSGCGGVDVVDRQSAGTTAAMVRTGRYAARVGGLSDDSCGSVLNQFVLVQPVTIPADAGDLTLSFWFSRLGPDLDPQGNSVADLSVSLSTDPFFATALFDVVTHNVLRGWMPFRGHLAADDLAAVRGQTMYLRFAVSFTGDSGITYFVDDVSLVAADVRTQAEPLPPALAGDGSRPLVLLQQNPANTSGLTVVRLDTDGTKPQAIDTGSNHAPRIPRWAPDGSRIAVVDDDVFPRDNTVPASLKAHISRLSVLRPDGSGRHEIAATTGMTGTSGTPPFCIPPQCVDLPRPALDQVIKGVEWSPDGRQLAITICARSRYFWGESDDDLCRVAIVDATSGDVVRNDLDGWFRPDWSATGGVLFTGPARFPDYTIRGVFQGDPSATPPGEQLILPAPTDLLIGGDRLPTWAPDGRHFVTAREIRGYRYGANGFAYRSEAVLLHDRDDLENPHVLVIADQGGTSGAIDDFTWSPDGRYVLYTLFEDADAANVWWLDVATGATGRVTDDGTSASVDWRQRDDAGPGSDPEPVPGRDLAVGALKPPKTVTLKPGVPSAAKTLTVQIQNRGGQPLVIPDVATLAALVTVDVQALGAGCVAPVAALLPGKPNKVPRTLKPKGKLNAVFAVTYECAVDPGKTTKKDPGHTDFRYVATVHPGVLDGTADDSAADDTCPRAPQSAADKGCGAKRADGALGADVTTDVVVK